MFIYPSRELFRFEQNGKEIILSERLNPKTRSFLDTLNFPITIEFLSYEGIKFNNKVYDSKIVQCNKDTICLIQYHSRFDSINFRLPKYDKIKMRRLFNKYYDFKDDNICYRISTDVSGTINKFEFYDISIAMKRDFLDELKSNIQVEPAIFNGAKTQLRDFDCISYITE